MNQLLASMVRVVTKPSHATVDDQMALDVLRNIQELGKAYEQWTQDAVKGHATSVHPEFLQKAWLEDRGLYERYRDEVVAHLEWLKPGIARDTRARAWVKIHVVEIVAQMVYVLDNSMTKIILRHVPDRRHVSNFPEGDTRIEEVIQEIRRVVAGIEDASSPEITTLMDFLPVYSTIVAGVYYLDKDE